jgi:hypothetical protein
MSRFRFSFAAPLTPDAAVFLETETGVAFAHLDLSDWFCVSCWNDHDAVVGVLTMEPRNWFDWHMSCAIADQRLMTRRLLRTIFKTMFSRAVRITALVDPGNERALKQVQRMGFVFEGFVRLGIEGTRDALMFGMLRADCPFLPGYQGGTIVSPPGRDMGPSLPPSNLANRVSAHAEASSDLFVGASRLANILHLLHGQASIAARALVRAVGLLVSHIRQPGFPAQMAAVNAGSNAAQMRGIWPTFWRRTMGALTTDRMSAAHLRASRLINRHHSIAVLVSGEGPKQALVAVPALGRIQKLLRLAVLGSHPSILSLYPMGGNLGQQP